MQAMQQTRLPSSSALNANNSKRVVWAPRAAPQQQPCTPTPTLLAPLTAAQHHPQLALTSTRAASNSTASTSASAASSQEGTPSISQSAAAPAVDYFASDKRPIILFDGVCNLCNGGVNFMLDWDKQGVYRLAALQSNPGRQLLVRCGRAADDISSIVLVEENTHYIKSDAILRIASRLGLPIPVIAAALMPLPHFIRDSFYDQVANNRYNLFGKTNTCRVSSDDFQDRFLGA